MPGRNPNAAHEEFLDPVSATISCLATAKVAVSGKGKAVRADEPYSLSAGTADCPLAIGNGIQFHASMQFHVYKTGDRGHGKYRVHVDEYIYAVKLDDAKAVAFHWHPNAKASPVSYPHMHIYQGVTDGKLALKRGHIPSGRVTLESIAIWMIDDLGATPKRDDWREILTARRDSVTRSWRPFVG